ncbi:unnamed protein product [Durusdinium trenchii]|uniref:5-amino-6-(D-ribitylamino)uracil--L-tyrosine 4-hydroxyphenyl transferase n=1 Tax=Durusdinium trenchii TaxID=1381693 RepID=A0ABP0MH33_9DINO
MRSRAVGGEVTYVVNRNINFTNVCVKRCGFCAFSRTGGKSDEGYFLPLEEILRRATEAQELGATEVCVQAGLPPNMQGSLYETIAKAIKHRHPDLHLHAFSPEEVLWGAKRSNLAIRDYLLKLKDAGVDSLPGTSAEILDNELRAQVSKGRISVEEWIHVVSTAHSLGFPTTSTMMFGFCESPRHVANHLILLRDLQKRAQESSQGGFTEFVPLGFVASEAPMWRSEPAGPEAEDAGDFATPQLPRVRPGPTGVELLRTHAVARLVFNPFLPGGIRNIQVSWVKEGFKVAQLLLACGANDLGGTLMNESISTAAGATHGQLARPKDLQNLVWSLGDPARSVAQRSTCYEIVRRFQNPAVIVGSSLSEEQGEMSHSALDVVDAKSFGSFHQLISSPDHRFASKRASKRVTTNTTTTGLGGVRGVHLARTGNARHFSSEPDCMDGCVRDPLKNQETSLSSVSRRRITYSPSFTLVPTFECFNLCTYCNFRKNITKSGDWMDEATARAKLKLHQSSGVQEILVMAGEVHPRASNRNQWVGRAESLCSLALDYGFLPHTNIGPLSRSEMSRLFALNASMGLMLETVSSLNGHGEVS